MPKDRLPVVMYAVCKLLQTWFVLQLVLPTWFVLHFAGCIDQMRNFSQVL